MLKTRRTKQRTKKQLAATARRAKKAKPQDAKPAGAGAAKKISP